MLRTAVDHIEEASNRNKRFSLSPGLVCDTLLGPVVVVRILGAEPDEEHANPHDNHSGNHFSP